MTEPVATNRCSRHEQRSYRTTPSIISQVSFFGQPMVMAQKSGAAICALMSTRAKSAISALSVLPPNRELQLREIFEAIVRCSRQAP